VDSKEVRPARSVEVWVQAGRRGRRTYADRQR